MKTHKPLKALTALKDYYQGKSVIVTGATSGIGRSTSLLLASLGSNVIILARTQNDLDKTLVSLNETKINSTQFFKAYAIDLKNQNKLKLTIEEILKATPVDILINNAGVYFTKYFQDQTTEEIEAMILTNMMAPLLLTRSVIPHFLSRRGGQIVNVSSLAAKLNFTGYGVYGATKAGLSHGSKGLQFELQPHGIYFSDFFAPDSLTKGYEEELKHMPVETKKINGTVKPMDPEDVAWDLLVGVSKKRLEIIPGLKSKAISFLAKHLSIGLTQNILRQLSK